MVEVIARAQGCLLGQLAGDALGSQVEFSSATHIATEYPQGVRTIEDGGYWNTLAGQPTDDSEMALLLARLLVKEKTYDAASALQTYKFWLSSGPFDVGGTISSALRGHLNHASQANGAMMRISPLGIFGAGKDPQIVAQWARSDAALTHPNPACLETSALFTMAIADAVGSGTQPAALYERVLGWAQQMGVSAEVRRWTELAATELPQPTPQTAGWVRFAWGNALYQLLHAASFEEALVQTVGLGGDTDTNAAIAGALLGAVHGLDAIPKTWTAAVLSCRPKAGSPNVHQPRPEVFWPVDALELAASLLRAGAATP